MAANLKKNSLYHVLKLAELSSTEKVLLNYQVKSEVFWANFNTCKRILIGDHVLRHPEGRTDNR